MLPIKKTSSDFFTKIDLLSIIYLYLLPQDAKAFYLTLRLNHSLAASVEDNKHKNIAQVYVKIDRLIAEYIAQNELSALQQSYLITEHTKRKLYQGILNLDQALDSLYSEDLNPIQKLAIIAGLKREQVDYPWFDLHHIWAHNRSYTFHQWQQASENKVLAVLNVGFTFEQLATLTEEEIYPLVHAPDSDQENDEDLDDENTYYSDASSISDAGYDADIEVGNHQMHAKLVRVAPPAQAQVSVAALHPCFTIPPPFDPNALIILPLKNNF